ncbi:hypothetical protein sscle_01g003030 [Sclerotinia sclerotiorum 1980 UF-70]|uniref:Uncharacterized protein n=1 Tax=Sclerotinia sclerotiorum (strain ATCC 18683 / 1980 / Ss-1) TaxID=665079 RepID=A0A1D9PTD7_SCLS1|nr:hypothetical protein sscle_01g003030 [Sclerotinia sclerotiorum 1980 UF-70]
MSYSDTNQNLPRKQEYANDGYSNMAAPTTAPATTPTTTPTTIQEPFPTLFKNLLKAIWCILVAFFPVLGFNNLSYQVGITPSNSKTPRIIFVSVAILGPLLLYAFWDIIYGTYLIFRAFIYTSSITIWTVTYISLSQSQRTLDNNNDERLLIPILELETTYKNWSDQFNSDMQHIFEVTDTETSSVKGNKIVAPPPTELIKVLARITSAIEIMSVRNSDSMRDQAFAFLVPKLQALQTRTSDLRKFYESYRARWAETLTKLAIECHKVAGRVSRLEHEWELILDEVTRIGNEGKGDDMPQPGSVLRRDCDDEHKPSRFAFGKAKQRSKYCTFEELASMTYH